MNKQTEIGFITGLSTFLTLVLSFALAACTPGAYRVSEAYVGGQPQSAEIVCEDAWDCANAINDFCPNQAIKVLGFRRHIKDHAYWSNTHKQWVIEPRETISLKFECKETK